ncbi:MAG: choice-of-anchor L domain-containing protein [Burkholderiales bacterium]|nr:choice-of-anchor L domain-containing protein [Burkholderiales bacterium]
MFAAPFSGVANAGAAAQALLASDSGITIVGNAQLNAASQAVALYDGSVSSLNIGAGLLLTSGAVPGTVNTMVGFGVDNARAGDIGLNAVLDPIFHTPSYDAASLSFTFTVDPTLNANSVSFNIVFGSEEFPEWIDSFVDAAAVWVNGTNYAMFNHDTYSPLSVVSQNVAAGYYIDNADGHLATEYDGVSRLLKITAPIHAGENTIRIAIADTGDHILDSGIFIADLKAGTSNGTGVTAVDDQGSSLDDNAYGSGMAEYFDLSSGDDSLTAGAGDDIIDGGDGNDDISGDDGNDAIIGGAGDDSARYHGNQAQFAVSLLADGNVQVVDLRDGSPEGTDVLSGVEKLHFDDGTFVIESLLGNPAPEAATTSPTAPTGDTPAADAQAAIDEQAALDAQAAEVTAAAEAEAAVQAAADAAAAQAAADAEAAAVAEAAAAELANQLAGLTVIGTGANDKLVGNLGSDTLDGGLGADSMAGGAGNDVYYVDDKKDVVTEAAGQGNDTVFATASTTLSANVENIVLTGSGSIDATGNALDNFLTGNVGKNVLNGGAGDDVIEGGGGIDQLTGGSGNDYFVFSSVSDSLVGKKHDVITDFEQGDMIDLSDIDAIIGTSTDDAFSYIGASAFSQEAGQLQFNAATGNLSGDVNGDGKADFEIHLNGVSSLTFDSFQL